MSKSRSLGVTRLLVALLPLLILGCVKATEAQPNLAPLAPPADSANRTECDQIYGTAFRSPEEREWYAQNCSKWPPVNVQPSAPGPQAAAQAAQAPLPPECAMQRGRPYASNEQRDWYLKNCQTQTSPATANAQPAGPDRQNCNEIRGTPYRSASERAWYVANCSGNANSSGSSAAPPAGPDRTDCIEVRGSGYRSAAERQWYLQSCGNR